MIPLEEEIDIRLLSLMRKYYGKAYALHEFAVEALRETALISACLGNERFEEIGIGTHAVAQAEFIRKRFHELLSRGLIHRKGEGFALTEEGAAYLNRTLDVRRSST
ncbi:MAG: hypothetical protein ACE5G0_01270 [Rhodothermales bacterium]